MGRRRQRAAGRREGRCAERLASRELSLYELDTSVHAFVPTGGAREQRLCGRARGQDAVWGPRFTGGRARRRGGSPSCDPGVRSQTGGPVCKLGVCPARPGAGGCGQCPLLRPVPTTSSQKSPQGRSSPPPAQNHSSPWLRTPAWVLPPLPPSRASATSKEHARPTAQEGGAQNLTPNTQGPRPSRSGPAPLRGTRHLLQEEHPAEAGAADQNLPSGPGSSEPSAFQPVVTAPPRVTDGFGGPQTPGVPSLSPIAKVGDTRTSRQAPRKVPCPASVEHRACLCAEAAAKYIPISRARTPAGLGVATWRHLAPSQERVNKRP